MCNAACTTSLLEKDICVYGYNTQKTYVLTVSDEEEYML